MKRQTTCHEHGLGLVEILIAVGIFLVGITAIVRVFPAGMKTMESTNSRTMASKLAESVLSQYESRLSQVGSLVFMYGGYDVFPDSTPDDPDPDSTVTGNADLDALDHARWIIGEKHVTSGSGTVVLDFAPVAGGSLTFYREVAGTTTPTGAGWTSAMVTLSAPGAASGDVYRVSYAWRDDSGTTFHVHNYRVNYTTTPVALVTPSSSGILVPGSITVVLEHALTPTLTSDSYTYGVVTGLPANTEVVARYSVRDWRWINDTVTLDANGTANLLFPGVDDEQPVYVIDLTTPTNVVTIAAGDTQRDDQRGAVTPSGFAAGSRVKVIYRTLDEWAVQVYRAPFTYVPPQVWSASTGWTKGLHQQDTYADNQWVGGNNRFLGFRKSSAGRGIVVDYNTASGAVRGEFHRIPVDPTPSPVYSGFPFQVQLNNPCTEIVQIRGATVRARIYWHVDGKWQTVQVERVAPLRAG